ncbi:MAG: hypothetical protein IJW48_05360 [Clostridia bacterium]|nr:hypothetical protein [Clostridia bacterium]
MRKTGRIVTLVLAVVTLILSIICLNRSCFLMYVNRNSLQTPLAQQYFMQELQDTLLSLFAIYFSTLYVVFTLKNGLGTELYAWSKEKHLQYLGERKEKQLLKQQKKKEKLQKKLEKLKKESDE